MITPSSDQLAEALEAVQHKSKQQTGLLAKKVRHHHNPRRSLRALHCERCGL